MPVEIIRRDDGKKFPSRKLKKVAQKVLEIVEQDKAELCLALVGNAEIRKLNAKFRKKDYPTDVLSFPAGDELPTGCSCSATWLFRSKRLRSRPKRDGGR